MRCVSSPEAFRAVVNHLIDVFGPPAAAHFADPPADLPAVSCPGTARGALRQLDDGHAAWIRDVRSLGAAGLIRPQGALPPPEFADAPMARLVLYTNVEIIHHSAEPPATGGALLWRAQPEPVDAPGREGCLRGLCCEQGMLVPLMSGF
jgi:hypothetical protein